MNFSFSFMNQDRFQVCSKYVIVDKTFFHYVPYIFKKKKNLRDSRLKTYL